MGSTGNTAHVLQPGQRVRVVGVALGARGERLEDEMGVVIRQAPGGYYEIHLDREPGESQRQCFYDYQLAPIDDPPR